MNALTTNNTSFINLNPLKTSVDSFKDAILNIHVGPTLRDIPDFMIREDYDPAISVHRLMFHLPLVHDVKVYNQRAVVVEFVDGSRTRAVCSAADTFSLETGISICLFKRILRNVLGFSGIASEQEATGAYNRLIRGAIEAMADREKEQEAEALQAMRKREKARRRKEALARRAERRREAAIADQAEAYRRALESRQEQPSE